MVTHSIQHPADPDAAISKLVHATRSLSTAEEFLQTLLNEAVQGLSAKTGFLWSYASSPEGELFLTSPNDEQTRSSATTLFHSISRELASACEGDSPSHLLTSGDLSYRDETVQVLAQPIARDRQLLVVCLTGNYSSEALHERQQFLRTICELREEFERSCELRRLREQTQLWKQFEECSLSLQGVSDLKTLGSLVVNESRHLCGFDRLHFVLGQDNRCRVEAVTAVDAVNRRSDAVRGVVDLTRAVVRSREDLVYDGSAQSLPEEIRRPLETCLKNSEARYLAVILLEITERKDSEPVILGALVAEHFNFELSPDAFSRFKALGSHVSAALARVLEWEVLPAKPLLRFWQSVTAQGRGGGFPIRRTLAAITIAVAVLCLMLIPVDFRVSAQGELQPLKRQNIFAQLDGTIVETRSNFDKPVQRLELLLKLSRPDLDERLEEVRGELSKTKARLDAIASLRVNPLDQNVRDERRLAAEESELTALEESLQKQLRILQKQQKLLDVKSPLAGTVLTWNAEDLLTSRYVRAGQILMTVADLEGPWVVDLQIPEKEIQFVNQAFADSSAELPVEILIDSRPDRSFPGTLRAERVARTTETDDEKHTFVPAQLDVPLSATVPHRPGTTVRVKIDCGRRSLGFVWFHDLQEWVYRNLLF